MSRPTIRQAIGVLCTDGLIVAEHGRGFFVQPKPVVQRLGRNRLSWRERNESRGTFLTDADGTGFTPRVEVSVCIEAADSRSTQMLGITPARPWWSVSI